MSNHCKEEIAATHWGRSRLTVSVIRKEIDPCASEHICEETAAPVNQAGANKAQQCAVDTEMLTMSSRPMPIRHSAGCWRRATPRALRSRRCAGNCGNTTSRSPTGSSRCPHRSTFPRSLSSHYLQIAVFVLALTLQCSSARTSGSKRPLITTDATRSPDFRTFMQGVVDERPSGRSLGAPDSLNDAESLDFQTLKVIKRWGNTTNVLLVSGRDYVYMLDSKYSTEQPQINYLERLTWRTPKKSQRECHLMGKKEYECQNFIRVVELMDDGRLMVCGTNAYTPACRYYKREQFNEPSEDVDSLYQSESMCRGQCVVPFNPATASATLYTNTDNGYQIFTAVVNDFLSNEPTILRKATPTLFSNRHWLNEPTFLKILEYGDKVYVFFRETAKESESGSSEEITYARVAQICKNDQGGLNVLAQQWTSFLKARLRCGYSNRGHLQFNNMTSVSEIVTVNDRGESDDVILATFTTPWEWEDASLSAVCAFSMKDIIGVFEAGQFLGEIELDAKPLHKPEMPFNGGPSYSPQNSVKKIMRSYPVSRSEQPETRPGSCAKMQTSPNVLYFAKEHPLMYDVINPYTLSPIFVTFNNVRATQIAVDNNAGDNGHLMIYIGTEDGKVLRLRGMLTADKGPKAVLLESIMVGMKENCELGGCGIRSLHVSRSPRVSDSTPSAFVAFTDHMVQFPLMRCNLYKSSRCCSTDPDCGWGRSGCVQRTYANRFDLSETLKDVGDIPESCDVTSGKPNGIKPNCRCKHDSGRPCDDEDTDSLGEGLDGDSVPDVILDKVGYGPPPVELDLEGILVNNVLPSIEESFKETLSAMRDSTQQNALRKQLREAIISTTNLVLKNHKQEYCLPTPTINQLTHVYPLLLREIEVWHQTALKKMTEKDFEKKCWGTTSGRCHSRISFSIPLAPALWEPLTKLITDFVGNCSCTPPHQQGPGKCSLPGLEKCTDTLQPHCGPKHCRFPQYAVDVKAFFRHANDSRQFLGRGDHIEPLWKAVNVTLPEGQSVRGHLELAVSERMPFVVDYSPVAEKVKITFHYAAVRDCALTESRCVGTNPGCNPQVEEVVDTWFRWTMKRMSHKLRQCNREIRKARRTRERTRRHGHELDLRSDLPNSREWFLNSRKNINVIPFTPDRCKRVSGKLKDPSRPISNKLWSLIVSRAQRTGGVYLDPDNSIEFYNLTDVIRFFKNMCTFEEPSLERRTFIKRARRGRSGAEVDIQALVSTDAPFVIERVEDSGRILLKYFTMQSDRV